MVYTLVNVRKSLGYLLGSIDCEFSLQHLVPIRAFSSVDITLSTVTLICIST